MEERGGYAFEVNNGRPAANEFGSSRRNSSPQRPSLTKSSSVREGGGSKGRRSMKPSSDDEFITLLHGSDPVRVELSRLENEVRGTITTISLFLLVDSKFPLTILFFFFDFCNICFFTCMRVILTLVCADKDRELSESQAEIKALRLSERQREKAVEEVSYHIVFSTKRVVVHLLSFLFFFKLEIDEQVLLVRVIWSSSLL